jgi:hypothetical protein
MNRAVAQALRTGAAGSQDESRCGAIQTREINLAATEA